MHFKHKIVFMIEKNIYLYRKIHETRVPSSLYTPTLTLYVAARLKKCIDPGCRCGHTSFAFSKSESKFKACNLIPSGALNKYLTLSFRF